MSPPPPTAAEKWPLRGGRWWAATGWPDTSRARSADPCPGCRLQLDVEVNGEPAVLGFTDSVLVGVLFFQTDGDRVAALRVVANPEKLRFMGRQLSQPGGVSGP
jgi:hypothetical protein